MGFIIFEACQQHLSRYVGQFRESLPDPIDDDPREWYLIETVEDKLGKDRRAYVDDVENGRVTGKFDDARFGMGRDWSFRMLFTRRIGVADAPWEILILRNQSGQLECLVYGSDTDITLPSVDGGQFSVLEVLDLSVEDADMPTP